MDASSESGADFFYDTISAPTKIVLLLSIKLILMMVLVSDQLKSVKLTVIATNILVYYMPEKSCSALKLFMIWYIIDGTFMVVFT